MTKLKHKFYGEVRVGKPRETAGGNTVYDAIVEGTIEPKMLLVDPQYWETV